MVLLHTQSQFDDPIGLYCTHVIRAGKYSALHVLASNFVDVDRPVLDAVAEPVGDSWAICSMKGAGDEQDIPDCDEYIANAAIALLQRALVSSPNPWIKFWCASYQYSIAEMAYATTDDLLSGCDEMLRPLLVRGYGVSQDVSPLQRECETEIFQGCFHGS
eukprot:TRINITY_DN8410_c0_g1_i1.p2 TRINITY_DN8410_c0_g1~~TRINITY_DN8410_c0_g1_i1.p2  ORF type:complete len:161 (-),score=6.74 TRINITY_DN8410_c0_g1_i1:36-518(-)